METTKTKYINIVGEDTGESYKGDFKFKCLLSPWQRIGIDKQYRSLLGENPHSAGIEAANLANILSELLFRVVDFPPFWTSKDVLIPGAHIPDNNVLLSIYEEALSCELEFKQEVKEKVKAAKVDMKEKLNEPEDS